MRILVIGGTVFVGRHFAKAAIAKGHQVTLLHRGSKGSHNIQGAGEILADRTGGFPGMYPDEWDVVVDTCGYLPKIVKQSVDFFQSVTRYLFVSTISVYKEPAIAGSDESAPVQMGGDPEGDVVNGETYGPLKVLCEEAVESVFGDRGLIVRPGFIVGPYDPTNRFTHWVERVGSGGTVLCPDRRQAPMQVIDVRDLAEFMVTGLENELRGIYNTAGPTRTWLTLLEACRTGAAAEIRWVSEEFLTQNEIDFMKEFPLSFPFDGNSDGLVDISSDKAIKRGLRYRPLEDTTRDTLDWWRSTPVENPPRFGISRERELELIALLDQG